MGEATITSGDDGDVMIISIHASRGGSDVGQARGVVAEFDISIHASRGGSDMRPFDIKTDKANFNPRFPWGKRPDGGIVHRCPDTISIHASRGGSDATRWKLNSV